MKNNLFKLGENLTGKKHTIFVFCGLVTILLIWQIVVTYSKIPLTVFPLPVAVVKAFWELLTQFNLLGNIWYSINLYLVGYLEALIIYTVLGFVCGLFPIFTPMVNIVVNLI